MENLISKELLSEVLYVNIKEIYKLESNPNLGKNDLPYSIRGCGDIEWINLYELALKCKEWAFCNGYELRSGRDIDVKEELCYFCEYKQERQLDYRNGDFFIADTEPEAVFKACQWILNNKEKDEHN